MTEWLAKSMLSSLMTELHPWDPNTARKFPGVVFQLQQMCPGTSTNEYIPNLRKRQKEESKLEL